MSKAVKGVAAVSVAPTLVVRTGARSGLCFPRACAACIQCAQTTSAACGARSKCRRSRNPARRSRPRQSGRRLRIMSRRSSAREPALCPASGLVYGGCSAGLTAVPALVCRHLRDLLRDSARSDLLFHEHNKVLADFSRQRITSQTLDVRAEWLRCACRVLANSLCLRGVPSGDTDTRHPCCSCCTSSRSAQS